MNGNEFANRAERQYNPSSQGLFDRGKILGMSKDGTPVDLATLTTGYKLAIVPDEIKDPENTFTALSPYISLTHDEFMAHANKAGDPYEEIAVRLPKESADAIKTQKLSGVYLYEDHWRTYPGGHVASKVIGFVGFKGDTYTGRYGLERQYNDVLSRAQSNLYTNFFAEIFNNLKDSFENKSQEGDIVTTIEPTVESMFEDKLLNAKEKYYAQEAGGIIMNPKTGEIIAMTALPDFDPAEYGKVKNLSYFGNPTVEHVYEPGSVMKALTMASAVDAGVVTPETKYNDRGFVEVNGAKLKNFDEKGRGLITMQQVLNESLNTGAVYAEQKLGNAKFRDYFYKLGLNSKTDIDLPGEVQSIVTGLESTRDVEYATASFGQGIALTPVSAIRAFSAMANAGTPTSPHIVKEIDYPDGTKKVIEPKKLDPVFKPETAVTMARMLTTVYEQSKAGIETGAKTGHWNIAAKTGTAQVPKEDGKGYYPDKYLHSMMGYFPAYDPKFIIFLYILDPHGEKYASATAAPVFADMAGFLLSYYQIPPDR